MHALLKLGLLLTMLCCCYAMIRQAWAPDRQRLKRYGVWLRALTAFDAVVLVIWLVGLLRA